MQKAKAPPLDREALSHRLYELGRETLKLEAVQNMLNTEIDRVKRRFAHRLETAQAVIDQLARDLRLACEDSREELLPRRRKSVRALFGLIGWRTQGDKVLLAKGFTAEQAAWALQDAGHKGYVRTKPEVDKAAIKDGVAAGALRDSDLRRFGLRLRRGGDDWYYEIDRVKVARQALKES